MLFALDALSRGFDQFLAQKSHVIAVVATDGVAITRQSVARVARLTRSICARG